MKNKRLLAVGVALMMLEVSVFVYENNEKQLFNSNVEALLQVESHGSASCYISYKVSLTDRLFRCDNPCEWALGEPGEIGGTCTW